MLLRPIHAACTNVVSNTRHDRATQIAQACANGIFAEAIRAVVVARLESAATGPLSSNECAGYSIVSQVNDTQPMFTYSLV